MLSIQHDLCRAQNNCYLGNWEIWLQWVQDNWELRKNNLRLGKYFLNGHSTRNCKSGTLASFYSYDRKITDIIMIWHFFFWRFYSEFPVVLNAPHFQRMTDLMTKLDDKLCPRRSAAPPYYCSSEHSTTRWVQKCLVCYCINDVICQGDMYTVAKKVILSVCCVVSC